MPKGGGGVSDAAQPDEVIPPAGEKAEGTSNALVPQAGAPPAVASSPAELLVSSGIAPKVLGGLLYAPNYMRLAQTVHSTEMVPKDLQGRPDAILAIFMRGFEMGLGPMQALDSFHVIQGKVGLKAESMRALILQHGHGFIISEVWGDDGIEACVAKCRRNDWPAGEWHEYRYGLEDARQDALVEWHEKWIPKSNGNGNYKVTWNPHSGDPQPDWVNDTTRKVGDNWVKKPRAMLDARCTSGAARRWFADVLAGMSYTPEEVAEFDGAPTLDEQPPPVAVPTQPPAGQPEGAPDSGDGGAGSPSGQPADATGGDAGEKTPPGKAAGSTKKAASRTTAAKKAAGGAEDAPKTPPSKHLDNGELRITPRHLQEVHVLFGKLAGDGGTELTRDRKLQYVRDVLADQTLQSSTDLSDAQGIELLDHLRIAVGDAPPPQGEPF